MCRPVFFRMDSSRARRVARQATDRSHEGNPRMSKRSTRNQSVAENGSP